MDSPKPSLISLGARVQEALEIETHPDEQLRMSRAQLLDHVTGSRAGPLGSNARNRAILPRQLRYAAGLATALALIVAAVYSRPATPISFLTGAGPGSVGNALEASAHARLDVEFSEGSRMLLHAGARARVLHTEAAGATVLLEDGVADVSIAHRKGTATRWYFDAGPFRVRVTGTQFELGWQPATQSLALSMRMGSVEVSGACLPAPRVLKRGESVRLSCASPSLPEPARAAHAQSVATPAASAATRKAQTARPRPLAREASAAPQSFEASCESASKAELVTWANRERLAGDVAQARTALLALRRRFPSSSEAGTAAFTLGRMAFDQRADYGDAARWFAAYLAEQPNGPLMGDARGRLLEAHERQGQKAAARREAAVYLRRFPDGPYASLARRILAE